MTKVIALIPARANSKGVPGKNIRNFGGHPLIAWSVVAAMKSHTIDRVIVSTDSAEYAEVARSYGGEVPFMRPDEISKDSSTDIEFVQHAVKLLAERDEKPEVVVHLRPTSPLREPKIIDDAVKMFVTNMIHLTSSRSVHEMSESAYKTFEIADKSLLRGLGRKDTDIDELNLPRQKFPITYMANGYVDVLKVDHLMTTGTLHGNRSFAFVTNKVIEIDTFDDCDRLDEYLDKHSDVVDKLFS